MAHRKELSLMLRELFVSLESILDPRIDQSTISEMGIDSTLVDLQEETDRGGIYFRPLSQHRLRKICRDPELIETKLSFFKPGSIPTMYDSYVVFGRICSELYYSQDDGGPPPLESTVWEHGSIEDSLEERLCEYEGFSPSDPTCQNEWSLTALHEAAHYPHRTCLSCHDVRDVIGLIRSELMILVGLMMLRLRRQEESFADNDTFPVLMISIIGTQARLLQAHISPEDQRIKVRYSQLFDFEHCPIQETVDLFTRWLLSEPLLGETPLYDNEEELELPPAPRSEVTLPFG